MSAESQSVRYGPDGPVAEGEFFVVREDGPVKWGHNGDGVVELVEFDDEKLREEFRQLEKDRLFFNANQAELSKKYRGRYVAIYQEEVAAVASTGNQLAEQLKMKGIRPDASYWQFFPTEHVVMIPSAWRVIE